MATNDATSGDERRYRDEEWLQEQYVEKDLSTVDIGRKCGVAANTVATWLDKFNIEIQNPGNPISDRRLNNEEWLRKQYCEQRCSMSEIAEKCDCSRNTVRRRLNKHGVEIRSGGSEPKHPKLTDTNWLMKQYHEKDKSISEIADSLGCYKKTVHYWMKENGVERKNPHHNISELNAVNGPWDDESWLHTQYVEEGKPTTEIATNQGVSVSLILSRLDEHGIPIRSSGTRSSSWKNERKYTDPNYLKKQYIENRKPVHKIANECDVSDSTVRYWLRKLGLSTRVGGFPSGKAHPMWNGGQSPYGPGWNKSKKKSVRERDNHTCKNPNCTMTQEKHIEKYGEKLHVHHLRKARNVNDPEERNAKENLITLCRDCHYQWERIADAGIVPQIESVNA